MKNEEKTLKDYAREAKKRLKSGFWQKYHENLNQQIEAAEKEGISSSKVVEYYYQKADSVRKGVNREDEEFYQKVKELLDSEGEVSDAIGRLTDKEYFSTLSFDQKQRYTLAISEKYVKAVERYKREQQFENLKK